MSRTSRLSVSPVSVRPYSSPLTAHFCASVRRLVTAGWKGRGPYDALDHFALRIARRIVRRQRVRGPVGTFPAGHRRRFALLRDEARPLHELVAVDVARTVREDLAG